MINKELIEFVRKMCKNIDLCDDCPFCDECDSVRINTPYLFSEEDKTIDNFIQEVLKNE